MREKILEIIAKKGITTKKACEIMKISRNFFWQKKSLKSRAKFTEKNYDDLVKYFRNVKV